MSCSPQQHINIPTRTAHNRGHLTDGLVCQLPVAAR